MYTYKDEKKILEITYDDYVHVEIKRAYDKIYEVIFISRLYKKLVEYIIVYSTC